MENTPKPKTALGSLGRLKEIVDRLRSPGGCPWDLEQTPESLKPFLLEEAHECAEAIESGNTDELRDELGDLLMNIFLQARIAEERATFTLADIADRISEKLIRRHPHVFGDVEAADSDAVRRNWEAIKREEKGADAGEASAIRKLPASLPALARADRVGRMAADVGFDWPDANGPLGKIEEELIEVRSARDSGDPAALEGEIGDLLFAISSFCRHSSIDPEVALRGALDRFTGRFRQIEVELATSDDRSLERLDTLWAQAKSRTAVEEASSTTEKKKRT